MLVDFPSSEFPPLPFFIQIYFRHRQKPSFFGRLPFTTYVKCLVLLNARIKYTAKPKKSNKHAVFFPLQETVCQSTVTIEKINSASYVLLAVNSASNFIIYMLRGDKFRRVLARRTKQVCTRGADNSNSFESPR